MRSHAAESRLTLFDGSQLEAARGRPLYRLVEDHLRQLVNQGKLIPGDLIPSESQLAKALSVSTGTVKKAIDNLVWEGLLFRHQGKGTYVSKIDFEKSLFRFFNYGDGSGRAVRIRKIATARGRLPGPPDVCRTLGVEPDSDLLYVERTGYIGDAPVLVEYCWWDPTVVPGLDDERLHIPDYFYAMVLDRFGVPVIRAEETLTGGLADEKTAAVIGIARGAPVIIIRRVAYTRDNRVVEVRTTKGRADRFSYKTEIR